MKYELEEYVEINAIQERVLPHSKVPYVLLYIFDRQKAREERIRVINYLTSRERETRLRKEARMRKELIYRGHNPRRVLKKFVKYSIKTRKSYI